MWRNESNVTVTCVCSFVNLKVFTSCKELSATRERTREWFFSCVHSDVIHLQKEESVNSNPLAYHAVSHGEKSFRLKKILFI